MSNPNQINSSNNHNHDNHSNPNIHSTITTPQSVSSSASTPYSFSSNSHQPPTLSRSNITPYNFQNIYNQQFQFSHQQQHPVQHQNDQFLTYDPAPGNHHTHKNQHQNPNPSDSISLQPDMQPLNSPISTQQHHHQQQQQQLPHPQSQGIIMSPAISSNLQYVHQTYFPPPTGPPQQIQLTIPNQNPPTSLNPGITQPMIGNLIPHRRTRVFWSRRDMDILISWIEENKPDCIGHGRRQDCERIKKEVFANRTEFTPKTIKEKLLNMKKKYRQATMIKNETSADSIKSEDDDDDKDEPRDDNQDDERFDLGINNPRFEGLSLKDRIEKICPFYDRIDRLKIRVQTEANPCKLSHHNPINLPQKQTIVADSEMNPETKKQLLEDVSIEEIVSILKKRQTSFSQNIMDPTADNDLMTEKQSESHLLIENIIKTVLPSFFSTNRGQNQATPNMPLSSLDPSLNPNAHGDSDNYNTVVASALAVAVSTFISTFNLGYGVLENHQKVPEPSAQPFTFQSVQSNDDLSLQISDKFNQDV